MLRASMMLVLAFLLGSACYAADPVVPNGDFQTGDFTNWTVTGTAFGIRDTNGTKLADSRGADPWNNESLVGTMKSANITLPSDRPMSLQFQIGGPNLNNNTNLQYVQVFKASDDSSLGICYSPGVDSLTTKVIDLSAAKGEAIYIKVVDNNSNGGFAWMQVDNFTFFETPQIRMVFDDFSGATLDPLKWTVTGAVNGGWNIEGGWARTSGDSGMGTLTSAPIPIVFHDKNLLFDYGGHSGNHNDHPGMNWVKIFLSTDLETPIATLDPPDTDGSVPTSFPLQPYWGKSIVIVATDTMTTGWGWIKLDNIRIQYDPNLVPVELSSFSGN